MKKWKNVPYLCLPVFAFGVSVWATPHPQKKQAPRQHGASARNANKADTVPAVAEAQAIHKEQQILKTKPGRVSCCIRPSCDFCSSHAAMCQCGKNILVHKPICRECKGGWDAGDGNISKIKRSDIRVMKTDDMIKEIDGTNSAQNSASGSAKKANSPR